MPETLAEKVARQDKLLAKCYKTFFDIQQQANRRLRGTDVKRYLVNDLVTIGSQAAYAMEAIGK